MVAKPVLAKFGFKVFTKITRPLMKHTLKILLALTILMASIGEVDAQINRRKVRKNNKRMANFKGSKGHFSKNKQYLSIGFAVNALNYFGDIAPTERKVSTDISLTRPGLGFSAAYRFGPRITARSTFSWGRLKRR